MKPPDEGDVDVGEVREEDQMSLSVGMAVVEEKVATGRTLDGDEARRPRRGRRSRARAAATGKSWGSQHWPTTSRCASRGGARSMTAAWRREARAPPREGRRRRDAGGSRWASWIFS
jgi:hypothetical protein